MNRICKFAFVAALGLSLSACSLFESDDEGPPVAELPEIEAKFEPEVLWKASVGNGVGDYFSQLQPAVGGDKLFAASRQGLLKAFEKKTGKVLWQVMVGNSTEGMFTSGPSARVSGGLLVADNKVFLGTENGELFAFSTDNGELIWRAEVPGEVISKPGYGDGIIVANTTSGVLVGLDATSGEIIWTFNQEVPPLTIRGTSPPVISNGAAIVGQNDGKITAIILTNGRQAWEEKLASPSGSTDLERLVDIDGESISYAGTVYAIAYNGNLAAIELMTGRIIWKREYSSFKDVSMNGINLTVTDARSHVYNLDRRSGIETWSQLSLFGRKLTSPAQLGEYAVVGDFEGYLHFLDLKDGSIAAQLLVDSDGLYARGIVDDDVLYVQSTDGTLMAINKP